MLNERELTTSSPRPQADLAELIVLGTVSLETRGGSSVIGEEGLTMWRPDPGLCQD